MKRKGLYVLLISCLTFITYSKEIFYFITSGEFLETYVEHKEKELSSFYLLPVNDECIDAVTIPVNMTEECSNTVSGTLEDATLSPNTNNSCGWAASVKDVWYSFTATSTVHSIILTAESTYDLHIELYTEDICNNTTIISPIECIAGMSILRNDFTIGTNYIVRVYATSEYTITPFSICVNTPIIPVNNDCDEAITLPVNTDASCNITTSSSLKNTLLSENIGQGCDATAPAKDIWFEFIATEDTHVVSLFTTPQVYDVYIQVFENSICSANTTYLGCGQESLLLNNLTEGTTYKIRVYTTSQNQNTDFSICVRTTSIPSNDQCEDAITVPVNSDKECITSLDATLSDATLSSGFGNGCGFGLASKDIWFRFTATTEIHSINLTSTNTNFGGVQIELYNDFNCQTPPANAFNCVSGNSLTYSALTPGNTYKIRIIASNIANNSDFNICIKSHFPPVNDECADAINVPVNIDGSCNLFASSTFAYSSLDANPNFGCTQFGGPVKDVWFQFVAESTSQQISILNLDTLYDIYIQVYEDIICDNPATEALSCSATPKIITGLTPGNTYKIRVYSSNSSQAAPFDICIRNVESPVNDLCENANMVPVNENIECIESIEGSFQDASLTPNLGTCNEWFMPVKDVWYEFVAIADSHNIQIEGLNNQYNVYAQVYEDSICSDNLIEPLICGSPTLFSINNLTIGNTYKIRVYNTDLTDNSNFTLCITTYPPPIKVETELHTVPELVSNVLINSNCANIQNVQWSTGTDYGFSNGIGYFNRNGSSFPFDEGIVLVSGPAKLAEGPAHIFNNPDYSNPDINDWLGDQQLTDYMNEYFNAPDTTKYVNATSVEFDFIPIKDSLKFNFIFASNEYSNGQQCYFSDVFAFFLTNTQTNETVNLAIVPDTNDPISVLTIRKAVHSPYDFEGNPICGDVNPEYFDVLYRDGFNGLDPLLSPINFYGRTVPMVAESILEPGVTYHLKLVVQDHNDGTMDSAVFLEAGSFDIGNVNLGEDRLVKTNNAICESDTIILETNLNSEAYSYKWYKDSMELSGETSPNLIISEPGIYKVEVSIAHSSCILIDEIIVETYPKLQIETLQSIEVCSLEQESKIIDLTLNESNISEIENNPDSFIVSYHLSEFDAEQSLNSVPNPSQYILTQNTQNIFMRILNINTGCMEITSFRISKILITPFTTVSTIEVCTYNDEIDTVNLLQIEENLRQQTTGPITLSYYTSNQDAENNSNRILNPESYVPASLPQSIFVKIDEQEISCSSIISFEIREADPLELIPLEEVIACTGYSLPPLPDGYFYSSEIYGSGKIYNTGDVINDSITIYINATNEIGCIFSIEFNVTIKDCNIPRGISPNGDGLNDYLDLTNYKPLSVKIYSRHGKTVFEYGEGYTNQWHGQDKNGNTLPTGTYFYKVTTEFEELTGYIYVTHELK